MTANSKFPCAINPGTGKPFTKHIHSRYEKIKFMYPSELPIMYLDLPLDLVIRTKTGVTARCLRPGCSKNIQT